jgi:O-antigen/teichoic acid export membrane protein
MKVDKAPPVQKKTPEAKVKESRSLGRRAGWALFWNVAFMPFKAGLSLVVALVIVKLFPRAEYVNLATITAMLATFGLFVDLGIERALPRFVGQIEKQLGRGALRRFLITITLVKMAVLALMIVVLATMADSFISWFHLDSQGRLYLALIAMLLVLGALYDICTQVLYSFFKQKVTNLLDIVVTVLNPLLTLGLIVWPFHLEVYGVMLALLITTIISVGIAAWQAWLASREAVEIARQEREQATSKPTVTLQPNGKPPESIWKRFTRYAALMYFFNFTAWFYDASFAILVFTFYNENLTVALVRLIYSFIKQLLKMLLTPFVGVQTPLFSSIHAEGRTDQLQAAYSSISKLQTLILVPSAIGVIVLARNLTELLFIRKSQDAVLTTSDLNLAAWATILTILFTFGEALISLPMVVLQVYERYKLVVISRILPLLVGPFLVLAAFMHWNVIIAVCIMGGMAVGSRLIALVALRQVLGLYFPVKFFWKVLKASLAFGVPLAGAILALPVNWPVTFGAAGLGVVIFLVVFRLLGGIDPEDKKRLVSLKLPFRKYVIKWL